MLMTVDIGHAVSAGRAITGSGLADLVTCERRFHNDMSADPAMRDPVNEFVEMLWREGSRHEGEIIAGLGPDVLDLRPVPIGDRVGATIAACRAGAPIIVGSRFDIEDRVGMPDVLLLEGQGYSAGDIKAGSPFTANGVDLKPTYSSQVGFYSRILQDTGWGDGRRCFVIGADGAAKWFDTGSTTKAGKVTIAERAAALTTKARGIRDGAIATTPASCAMCGLCVWKSACKAELEASDDVTLVAGVGRSVRSSLAGVAGSVSALATLPIGASAPAIAGIGATRLNTFIERARSLATPGAEAYAVRPLGLSPRDRELHLDIETDPTDDNLVYLFGIRERLRDGDASTERYVHFLAVDKWQERDAFADAMAFLSEDPGALITVYSAFEKTTFRMLQRRYPEVATVEQVEALFAPPRCVDLYFGAVLPSTVWPLPSLGLKPIARHLGFQWKDHRASGAASIRWFVDYAQSREPALLERILQYNSDDCTASMIVFDGLLDLPVRGPLPPPPSA